MFSTINLTRAYQIPVAPEDRYKTVVINPFGLYEFNVMTFGLYTKNAIQSFQSLLRGLDFYHCYVDDIVIASESFEKHEKQLRTLFERRKYGLTINIAKYVFV